MVFTQTPLRHVAVKFALSLIILTKYLIFLTITVTCFGTKLTNLPAVLCYQIQQQKPIECEIFQGKQLVQNHDKGVVMSTQSLVLQKVDREDLIFALRME